jgi:WD40 repeat protein
MRHNEAVIGASFDRKEKRVLTWSADGTVRLWDTATQHELGPSMGHTRPEHGAVLDQQEQRILSWTNEELSLWDATTQQLIGSPLSGFYANSAAFDRSGRRILVGANDGTIWVVNWAPGFPTGSWRLKVETETGTHVTPNGEVEALSPGEWKAKYDRYRALLTA